MREDCSENKEGGRITKMREDCNKNKRDKVSGFCLTGEREKCSGSFLKGKKGGSYFLFLPKEEQ